MNHEHTHLILKYGSHDKLLNIKTTTQDLILIRETH